MGFFNFLYKLSNIFTNKKRLKFFIVVGLIILFVFAMHTKGYCSTAQDDLTLLNYQISLQNDFIDNLIRLNEIKPAGFDNVAFNDILNSLAWAQVYVNIPTDRTGYNFEVFFYAPNGNGNNPNLFTVDGTWSVGVNSGTQIDCMLGDITFSSYCETKNISGANPVFHNSPGNRYIPSAMYCVRSVKINEYLQSMGRISSIPSTYKTSDLELQAITRSGFGSVNSTIQNQTNTMTNSINSASASITNSIDSVENTLTDTSTDDSQVEFVSENNQDITSGFFTSIFTNLQNRFITGQFATVVFNVPFTGKRFVVTNRYIIENVVNNEKFSVLVTIAQNFWWFALGYYVILDIYKKINKLKSGDLTNIENENITTDLL